MKAKKKTTARKNTALVRRIGPVPAIAKVATEIRDLIEAARSHVSVTANLALVSLYWNIGRVIAQDIQKNEKRAEYGTTLLRELAEILTHECGKGYSRANLQDMRRFFESFEIYQTASSKLAGREILQTPSGESCERLPVNFREHFRLGWSHYRLLLSQSDPIHRTFYFEQAAEQRWTVRELRRQIDHGLFERVALSKDTPRLVAQEKQTGPAEIVRYEDIFKDPYVIDFLGLKGAYSERDLEAAIVHNLEELLLRYGPHKMKVAEYLTRLPDKRVLEERLKMYSRLLREQSR